ncbi:unnamed protein product [Ceratitis capitata]|uniref:(Mediterranean fruit fly) hypothetical protein n=1 Tax=Ceratitis capitata TaxID=7213 RepID=A0A811VJE4_CERCA|nr:unnamed protein product [Ceratitis capitata]
MEEFKEEVKVDYFNPIRMNTLGIPQEHDILTAYDVYRPALETRALKSEQERTLYAEHFIENTKLGPLRDLCIRALTLAYTPKQLPLLAEDPLKIRLYYDSLSIDLPLEQCYDITDEIYWRRYVLAKNKDVTLAFKKDYNWRSLGLSMKFVELVEHKRLHLDDSEESESDSTDVESMTATPRSTDNIIDLGSKRSRRMRKKSQRGTIKHVTRLTAMNVVEKVPEIFETEEQLELERIHEEITKERKERTPASNGEKEEKFRPKGVFDMIVEPAEDDGEELIVDRRNLKQQLTVRKKLHYPTRLCHHVSLRFLRFFENLVNFTIEFRGPDMQRDFHERHLKFSHADVEGLAYGVSFLQKLKIFRLRSSQMDARKLYTLAKALKSLVCIETIDFGYDHLDDDCGLGLLELFRQTNSIKSLELEHNLIGAHALHFLAIGISQFGGQLEYLGLGGNPLGDWGLHELSTKVVDTQHITNLSLSTSQITETAIDVA